jgi:hypothetical protein
VDDDSKRILFGEGSTPLGTASGQKTTIFQKMLEMYHFGLLYLEIWLTDLGEIRLVEKVR